MGVREELRTELVEAMKAKDRARINVIRQVESEVAVARSAPDFGGEVDDELYEATITAYVKRMEKARQEYEGFGERGEGQAAQLAYEIDFLSRWLPESVSEDETRQIVRDAVGELGIVDAKMAGKVTGHVMRSRDGLDGALVNRLVREELGA